MNRNDARYDLDVLRMAIHAANMRNAEIEARNQARREASRQRWRDEMLAWRMKEQMHYVYLDRYLCLPTCHTEALHFIVHSRLYVCFVVRGQQRADTLTNWINANRLETRDYLMSSRTYIRFGSSTHALDTAFYKKAGLA